MDRKNINNWVCDYKCVKYNLFCDYRNEWQMKFNNVIAHPLVLTVLTFTCIPLSFSYSASRNYVY